MFLTHAKNIIFNAGKVSCNCAPSLVLIWQCEVPNTFCTFRSSCTL